MTDDVQLRCKCGAVAGTIVQVNREQTAFGRCYCDDCQAFAHWLGDPNHILDQHGGSSVVMVAPARFSLTQGLENIRCIQLGPKGLMRHYCASCKTPTGNLVGPGIPFIGIVDSFIASPENRANLSTLLGPPMSVYGKFAKGQASPPIPNRPTMGELAKVTWMLFRRKVQGLTRPHPYFDASAKHRVPSEVLSAAERERVYAAVASTVSYGKSAASQV